MSAKAVRAAIAAVTGALPAAEDRAGQRDMAIAVDNALATGRHLVVAAGTGTGKTMGYLIPAVLAHKRVIVATATKALQDALALQRLALSGDHWPDVLAAFDAERASAGAALVELGRRIGRDHVENTPDWGSMTPDDFDAWTRATLSGEALYFYGNVTEGRDSEDESVTE